MKSNAAIVAARKQIDAQTPMNNMIIQSVMVADLSKVHREAIVMHAKAGETVIHAPTEIAGPIRTALGRVKSRTDIVQRVTADTHRKCTVAKLVLMVRTLTETMMRIVVTMEFTEMVVAVRATAMTVGGRTGDRLSPVNKARHGRTIVMVSIMAPQMKQGRALDLARHLGSDVDVVRGLDRNMDPGQALAWVVALDEDRR